MSELLIQDNNAIIARAEIDTMIATAKAYPRDVTQSIANAVALATMSEEVAASCFYALPRKDKDGNKVEVKGASVRLAEIMASSWGNLHAATRIIEVAEKHITTEGVAWDLQSNVRVTMPDKVGIWFGEKSGKGGFRANNDMQVMLTKASCSKAFRNAVFRVIPKAFVDSVLAAAQQKAIGDSKTVSSRVKTVVDRLVKMGINQAEMLEYFGYTKIDDITADDLATLIGIGTALKEGIIKPEDVFKTEKMQEDKVSAKEALANLVNPKTGEVV